MVHSIIDRQYLSIIELTMNNKIKAGCDCMKYLPPKFIEHIDELAMNLNKLSLLCRVDSSVLALLNELLEDVYGITRARLRRHTWSLSANAHCIQ